MKWVCALCVLLAMLLVGCTMVVQPPTPQPAEETEEHADHEMESGELVLGPASSGDMSVDEKIANALTAGPPEVAAGAAVVDWPSDASGTFPELRPGTNGWTCLPDDPVSPTNDPYCLDSMWIEHLNAYIGGRDPEYTDVGFGYMLQGGTSASNTDPSLMEPAEGDEWLVDGPHFMVVAPVDLDPAAFPVEHGSGLPYIMFEGTPYEHLMIPVETVASVPADDKIANALSAGPSAVAEGAAVMDWPSEAGGEFTELRAGTNGWTCFPDDPTTPSNDPLCGDAVWLAWLESFIAGEEPVNAGVGLSYMLQGGTTASNEDPTLLEPAEGEDWLVDGPHAMVLSPNPLDQELLGAEHRMDGAYIMYPGTPFEHVMIPAILPASE